MLEYFLTSIMIQFSLKSVHIWKSYSKKTKGSRFYGTRCIRNQCYGYRHDVCLSVRPPVRPSRAVTKAIILALYGIRKSRYHCFIQLCLNFGLILLILHIFSFSRRVLLYNTSPTNCLFAAATVWHVTGQIAVIINFFDVWSGRL